MSEVLVLLMLLTFCSLHSQRCTMTSGLVAEMLLRHTAAPSWQVPEDAIHKGVVLRHTDRSSGWGLMSTAKRLRGPTTGLAVRLSSRREVKAVHRRSPGGGGSHASMVPSMLLMRTFSRSGILQTGKASPCCSCVVHSTRVCRHSLSGLLWRKPDAVRWLDSCKLVC